MIDVVIPVHNEEKYLENCLRSVLNQTLQPHRVIVILDRCTDRSENIARRFPIEIIKKEKCMWRNSYAEDLQIGFEAMKNDDCKYFAIVDADVILPKNYFKYITYRMKQEGLTCASGRVVDKPKRKINKLIALWKRFNLKISPLGKRPRGCALIIHKEFLKEINGFKDVTAPDTYIQNEILNKNQKIKLIEDVVVEHVRDEPLKKTIKKQFQSGIGRHELGYLFGEHCYTEC